MKRIQHASPCSWKNLLRVALGLILVLVSCGKEPTDEEKRADALREESRLASSGHQTGEARQILTSLIELDRKNGKRDRVAEDSERLAANFAATADYDSAFYYAEESYKSYRAVADKYSERRIRIWTASLYRWTGEERKALETLSELLRIARVLGDMQAVTELNWHVLPLYRVLGMQDEEQETLTELLNIAQGAGRPAMQSRVYFEWGRSYYYREEFGEAMSNFLRAFTLADQSHDSLFAVSALSALAMAYEKDGNRQEAFQAFTDGLTRADKIAGTKQIREEMLVRVGNIYLLEHQYAEAERFYKAALPSAIERHDKLAEGYLFVQLGHCSMQLSGKAAEASKNYQIALDLFTSYGYAPGIAYSLGAMGIAEMRAGDLPKALELFTSANANESDVGTMPGENDLYLECESAFYESQGIGLHDAFLEVLLRLGKYEDAFVESEREKGEGLSDVFRTFAFDTGRQETTAALWEAQRFEAMERGAVRELARALSVSSSDSFVLSRLKKQVGEYKRLSEEAAQRLEGADDLLAILGARPSGIADIQKSLVDGSVLLTAVPTTRSVFVFAIDNSHWTVQIGAMEKGRFKRLVSEYNTSLAGGTDGENGAEGTQRARLADLSNSLYLALVRPVESFVRGAERLIIVPSQELVPYHSLRRSSGRKQSPYLIQSHQISYLPTASMLEHVRSPAPAAVDIMAMGYPGSTDWDVEYELRDIRAFYKDARLYFGKDATFAALQEGHGSILHLALEFSFDPLYPGNSSIIFSNGQNFPGPKKVQWGRVLALPEFPTILISDLSVHKTIPACKPFVFLMGETHSVMMTQFSAHRKTKKYFGELFYTSVTAGKSADVAYTNALRGMIDNEEYASPSVWATFYRWGE